MIWNKNNNLEKPFPNKTILQILVVLLLLLAIAAGYYYTAYGLEQRKNDRLERRLLQLEQLGKE